MLLQPSLCVIQKVEDTPILLCFGGQGSFLLNNTSLGWLIENRRAQLTQRSPSCTSSGAHLLGSFAQAVSSATAMVAWPCWGWALLCYPLVFTFFLNKATPVLVKNSKDFVNLVFGLGVETHFDKKGFIIKWISSWNKQMETRRDAEKQSKIWNKKY